jgi:hypothetical protein
MHEDPHRTLARSHLFAAAGLAALALGACAEMRQNWRSEFVSYRGAWFCGAPGCDEAKMQRSAQAHREGDLTINYGKIANGAALVFKAGKTPDTFTADVSGCGKTADVPTEKIKAPGAHGVPGQGDAHAVVIDPNDYPDLGGCKKWTVTTHASWPKGKWDQKGGIEDK